MKSVSRMSAPSLSPTVVTGLLPPSSAAASRWQPGSSASRMTTRTVRDVQNWTKPAAYASGVPQLSR